MKGFRVGNKSSHGVRCYASGGRVPEDISDKSSLPKVSGGPGKADGGMIDGGKAKRRLDRPSSKPVTVNVVVAGKDSAAPSAMAPPMGASPVGPPLPPAANPGPGPMPPMPMRKNGGRVMKHSDEAEDKKLIKSMVDKKALKERAAGGRVKMDAGAGSGEGRMEKVDEYGKNAGKPANGK